MIKGNVYKRIGNREIKINLDISKGERVLIRGSYGSGKSSLAHILLGLTSYSGNISLQGSIDIVFQDVKASLDPKMRVQQLIEEPCKIKGLKCNLDIAKKLDLDLNKPATQLSSGEATRVAIARSLSWNPKILVIDEALSYLDVLIMQKVWNILKRVETLIVISHDMDRALFDKVIDLN